MNPTRFDRITRRFAERKLTRRQVLATGGTGLAAAGVATTGLGHVTAQGATPAATPGPANWEKTTYLFVQSFQSGSIAPAEGAEGRYTVTLDQGLGQTIYFGDRPSRDVGTVPTANFLEGLGFLEGNPPNAALVLETEPGVTDIAVVELFTPTYDEATHTATYEVEVLENWQESVELGFQQEPTDLASLASSFGTAHLLIDDCPSDSTVDCIYRPSNATFGTFTGVATCWNYSVCMPCEPYGNVQPDRCATQDHWTDKCNQTYTECGGSCGASFPWPFANC